LEERVQRRQVGAAFVGGHGIGCAGSTDDLLELALDLSPQQQVDALAGRVHIISPRSRMLSK
jgi:hypothetical protein